MDYRLLPYNIWLPAPWGEEWAPAEKLKLLLGLSFGLAEMGERSSAVCFAQSKDLRKGYE